MESLSLDISDFYAWGYLRVFPVHLEGIDWSTEQMRSILNLVANHIKTIRENIVIIDSLTMFTTYSTEDDVLEFLTRLKTSATTERRFSSHFTSTRSRRTPSSE